MVQLWQTRTEKLERKKSSRRGEDEKKPRGYFIDGQLGKGCVAPPPPSSQQGDLIESQKFFSLSVYVLFSHDPFIPFPNFVLYPLYFLLPIVHKATTTLSAILLRRSTACRATQ